MKKFTAAFLALLAVLLCACGNAEAPSPSPSPSAAAEELTPALTAAPAAEPTAAPEQTTAPTTEPAPEPTPDAAPEPIATTEPTAVSEPTAATEPTVAPAPAATAKPTAAPEALPYSVRTADTVLEVKGTAAGREWYFTLAELQSLGGAVSADYFSRGKDPQELTTSFEGISVQYLFESVMGLTDYKKATFRATDGYSVSFSKSAVGMTYINEQDESAQLKMILAWRQDGEDITLRLAMGQMTAGEYNRTNWVRSVCEIEVKS